MGHDKLRKFAENETFSCLLQPSASELLADGFFALRDHAVKGRWNETMFDAPRPVVLELGCGKGEYTIDLSQRMPDCNYIGVDIKGARLWKGAKYAHEHRLGNVAFLRTRIEFIGAFFAPDEVSEICEIMNRDRIDYPSNDRDFYMIKVKDSITGLSLSSPGNVLDTKGDWYKIIWDED